MYSLLIIKGDVSKELPALPIDLVSKSLEGLHHTVLHHVTLCYTMLHIVTYGYPPLTLAQSYT